MIERSDLESINAVMIGRGRPDEKDEMGYNVPDYNKLSSIWFGATLNDLYEISSRLLKYYDTQLESFVSFSKDELIETIEYYQELSKKNIVKNSISVGFSEDFKFAYIGFKYNNDYINVLRNFKYQFDKDLKSWFGSSSLIKSILERLSELGADTENALLYVEEHESEKDILFDTTIEIEDVININPGNILEVKEVDENTVSLKFDYDNDLVQAIRQLRAKSFNWDSKLWNVSKFELKNLYETIQHLDYDFSQLNQYFSKTTLPIIKVVSVSKGDIELSFPNIVVIVEIIKKLTYYQFDRGYKTWKIDIRERDLLVELIGNIADTTQLKEIAIENNSKRIELKDYSYLERKPFKHQYEAANFLLDRRKAIIGDEMGSGKTLSSILASYSLPSPRLIICPASLKLNWAKEIRMVDSNSNICVIDDKGIKPNADWYIINYDILEREFKNLSKYTFSCISLDECHYIKSINNGGNPNSKRSKYTIELADKCDYVFSLSGTPITNKPKDIYNILKVSNHILSKNFFSFAQQFCGATHNGFGWDFNGSSNEDLLHKQIKPIMLRRLKKDMLDLPEKVRRFIPVEINMGEYNSAVEEYLAKKPKFGSIGAHLPYLVTIKHILAKAKVKSTVEIAENILEGDESVVIFTNYQAVVDNLMEHFGGLATKITGSCNVKNRQQAVEDFQSGKKKVMIANIIAGGVGITLIEGNNLIFNDFDWVPANHFQAEDRIHRIGQTKNCTINYVYVEGAEIDEYMSEMLERKSKYINQIIDGGEGDQLDFQKALILNLYKTA